MVNIQRQKEVEALTVAHILGPVWEPRCNRKAASAGHRREPQASRAQASRAQAPTRDVSGGRAKVDRDRGTAVAE